MNRLGSGPELPHSHPLRNIPSGVGRSGTSRLGAVRKRTRMSVYMDVCYETKLPVTIDRAGQAALFEVDAWQGNCRSLNRTHANEQKTVWYFHLGRKEKE